MLSPRRIAYAALDEASTSSSVAAGHSQGQTFRLGVYLRPRKDSSSFAPAEPSCLQRNHIAAGLLEPSLWPMSISIGARATQPCFL